MRRIVVLVLLAAAAATAAAGEADEVDIDAWHRQLREAIGPEPEPEPSPPALGIFPSLGVVFGPPNWISGQANAYLSYSNGRSFSLYGGLGVERGGQADAVLVTLGWGGVRQLPAAARQLGFHGKYLRYRQWDHDDHGRHYGLSVGTETGLGHLALSFELGAARSDRNHWILTAQACLKVALPIHIPVRAAIRPLSDHETDPDS